MTDATNTADTTEQDAQKRLRIRVAHCYRDDTGMLRSREGWLALSEPKPTEKNDSFLVSFPDTGKSELVPAKQLQILSMDCGGNLQVVHVVRCDNNAVVRKGAIVCPGSQQEKVCVRFKDSGNIEEVSVQDLMLIGYERA